MADLGEGPGEPAFPLISGKNVNAEGRKADRCTQTNKIALPLLNPRSGSATEKI